MSYYYNTLDNKVKINYDNLKKNIGIIKNYNNTKNTIAVVKNDAYNLGIEEVVKACYEKKINFFAVSNLTEAIKIYDLNLNSKILILNPLIKDEFEVANELKLHVIIHSLDSLYTYAEYINELINNKIYINVKFHLKINVGMNRYGLKSEEVNDFINFININDSIKTNLIGLMTHFPKADEDVLTIHNEEVQQFVQSYEILNNLYNFEYIHSENSAAFLLNDKRLNICNYARIGILLYGYKPIKSNINLYPTMYLKSKISYIRNLQKDDFLGYGTFKVLDDVKIGICTIGYGDGLIDKRNEYPVYIKGNKYEIVGNISMSHLYVLIDEKIKIGDEVEIYGDNIRFDDIKSITNSKMMCPLKR